MGFSTTIPRDLHRGETLSILRAHAVSADFGEDFIVSNYLSKPSDRLITFLKVGDLTARRNFVLITPALPPLYTFAKLNDILGESTSVASMVPLLPGHAA